MSVAVKTTKNVTNTHAKPDFGMLCKYMRIVRCSISLTVRQNKTKKTNDYDKNKPPLCKQLTFPSLSSLETKPLFHAR
jgi:hypothetical protein